MDDKTRRVGPGDDMRGRSDEQTRNYATTPARADKSADLDPDASRRAREIESEIAHTRAEMSETIEAIQDKLRPANLVSDATDRVKAATTEKVRNMADTASETAQDVMRETRERAYDVVEGAKNNPIPALMIGAGVAWLLMDRSRNKQDRHAHRNEWSQFSAARDLGYEPVYSDVESRGKDYSSGSSGAGSYRTGRSNYSSSEGMTSRSMDALGDVRDSARQTARRTQGQLQRMLRDNPLLVGAAAVLAGAAVGASLPETERENELMGEARDSVVDKAQEAARDAASTVREVAGEAVEKVTDKVAPKATDKAAPKAT